MKITEISTKPITNNNRILSQIIREKTTLNDQVKAPKMKLSALPSTSQYLSFAGYSLNLAETIKNLDALTEKYPNLYPPNMREFAQTVLDSGNMAGETLISLHKKHYAGLLECETLEQAKERYPEFENVLSSCSVPAREGSFLDDFKQGKLEYFDNVEDWTLQILKLYWAKGFSLNDLKRYANDKSMSYILKKLNIPVVDPHYGHILKLSDPEYNARLVAEMREKFLARMDRLEQARTGEPVYIKRGALSETQRAHISEGLKHYFETHPEAAANLTEKQKAFYREHPEYCVRMSRVVRKAWFTKGSDKILEDLSKFMKKKGDTAFSLDLLPDPTALSANQSELMKKFWELHPRARAIFSNNMKLAWQRVKAEDGVVHTFRVLPQGFIDRFKKWAKEKHNKDYGDEHFVASYTPNTNVIAYPGLLKSDILNDFICASPNGGNLLTCTYGKAYLNISEEYDKLNFRKTNYSMVNTIARQSTDMYRFFSENRARKLSPREFIEFYGELCSKSLFEFNPSNAEKLQAAIDKAFEEELKEVQQAIWSFNSGANDKSRSMTYEAIVNSLKNN